MGTLLLICLTLLACGDGQEQEQSQDVDGEAREAVDSGQVLDGDPPGARRDLLLELRRARDMPRSTADGAGRAWLELDPDQTVKTVRCGVPSRFSMLFEAGPEGVKMGGFIRFTAPPFWGWSPAQVERNDTPGFTTAESLADGVTLEVRAAEWVDILIGGRDLGPGEQLRIVYGAGSAGAAPDRYTEKEARLWITVDGDGDGVGSILLNSPTVDVQPGPVAQFAVVIASTAAPGDEVTLRITPLDTEGNRGVDFRETAQLLVVPEEGLELPETVELGTDPTLLTLKPTAAGVYRIMVQAEHDGSLIAALSNPLLVAENIAPIRWGDLHGHSGLSDGTGTPEDFLAYGRDVAGLDVICLTDHDHWGMVALDEHTEQWDRIKRATAAAHEPGKFVALLGYEWTSWVHGHRHVLYFEDDGPVLSSIDERYETPAQLWDALRGTSAMTFAHHSAGGPVPTDWSFAPDPELEPLTEITSVHGSSESADSPGAIYNLLPGNTVRDAVLERGYNLGFVGSGDGHDGHPGLAHLSAGKGGLAAILTDDLTRSGVRSAFRGRRTYATTGQRIILRAALDGHRMGEHLPEPEGDEPSTLFVRAIGTAPIQSIDVVTRDAVLRQERGQQNEVWDLETLFELPGLKSGDALYVRVIQVDGACAWSSPFFVD
ncbi:MAG: hypothetical protein ACI8QS_000145 [Planctomycetota bacterium]|jgi:hypothetical protein